MYFCVVIEALEKLKISNYLTTKTNPTPTTNSENYFPPLLSSHCVMNGKNWQKNGKTNLT